MEQPIITETQAAESRTISMYDMLVENGLLESETPVSSEPKDCFVDLTESVTETSPESDRMAIDTRHPNERKNPVALNTVQIPLYLLKSKRFLKNKKLVLVHNAYNYYSLRVDCIKLKNSGFADVSIVTGGVDGWHRYLKTTGSGNLNLLSPQNLYSLPLAGMWLVFELSDTGDSAQSGYTRIGPDKKSELNILIQSSVTAYRNQHGHSPNILIANQNGIDYGTISKQVNNDGKLNVFFLDGGTSGFFDFYRTRVEQLKQNNNRRDNPVCRN
jgi:rhodanese-related sulfurtransferase